MRKGFLLLLVALLVAGCACAESEILFQGISWLSNEETTIRNLTEKGFLRGITESLDFSNDKPLIINENTTINYQPNYLPEYSDVCFSASLGASVKGRIAGYPVKDITLTFLYDGEYKLIAAEVGLVHAEYSSLLSKIKKVYGDGETKAVEDEGIEATVWKGANNTGILLYTENNGMNYQLIYGRLDANELLEKCCDADPNEVSGL